MGKIEDILWRHHQHKISNANSALVDLTVPTKSLDFRAIVIVTRNRAVLTLADEFDQVIATGR
jgi:hypothetical protein